MDAIITRMVLRLRQLISLHSERTTELLTSRPPALRGRAVTEPVLERSKVIREGWCMKESDHLKVWRRRWLVLTRQKLCTFKLDDKSYSQPTSSIDMSNAICSATSSTTIVVRELRNKGSAQENAQKVYSIRFADGIECRAWLAVLHEVIMAQDAPRANVVSRAWESLYHTAE